MSGRYRKLLIKMWGDEKFRRLSRPQPNGQSLFIYLITGPHTNPIPGLFRASETELADSLGWPLEGFREAFGEAFGAGMVKADWKAHLVFLPKAIVHNKPESPNVVKSWVSAYDLLPECGLRDEALQTLKAFVEGMGEGFTKAFHKAFPGKRESLPESLPESHPKQAKQIRVDDNGKVFESKASRASKAFETASSSKASKALETASKAFNAPGKIEIESLPENKNGKATAPEKTVAVWSAYCGSYRARYGEPPVRNASVNMQLANFLKRIPAAEAPEIAKFYVQSNNQFYAQQGHTVFYLLRDAEKLRTEWKTGKRMTATGARSADQREERGSIGQHLLDKAAKQREGSHA